MTVCTASAFVWIEDAKAGKFVPAIVAAADRKLTDLGLHIGYDSSKWKGAAISKNLILVAGDIAANSTIVGALVASANANPPSGVLELAANTGATVAQYKRQEAERRFLSPLGLTSDSFIDRQQHMDPALVTRLSKQMQDYELEIDTMVLGCTAGGAGLFNIDNHGVVTNHSDIGFLSIGSGGVHSSAYFMRLPFNHNNAYYRALYHTYAAKKFAEVDPYVGDKTNLFVVKEDGVHIVPPEVTAVLEEIYEERLTRERDIPDHAERRLMEMPLHGGTPTPPTPQNPPGTRRDRKRQPASQV